MLLRLVAPILLSLVFAGCVASGETNTGPKTTVEVINQNFYDMNVYLLRTGQRVRLGNVRSNSTRVLNIPSYVADTGGAFRFLLDPVGGSQTPITRELFISPGEQIQLVIPAI